MPALALAPAQSRVTDDDVTMDLDSDNLDEQQDECIDEGDSEMARDSAKARSLARAAIAEADHQEKDENEAKNNNQPVGDGEKPDEDNASTEDVRAMWGDSYGDATVSAHVLTVVQQTLETIERIQETHEKEKKEAEQREMRLKNQITEMNDKLTGLMTVRPGNGSISHSGSRPDNGSKISKFGIFAVLTSSCWWYSKVDLLYILGSMFVTLLDENCKFATHNSLMICMNC